MNNQNRKNTFLILKKTDVKKGKKPKTATDTKTEKPEILSAKTEKPISKMTKTVKPKTPMSTPFDNQLITV